MITQRALLSISLLHIQRILVNWYYRRAEEHYLISACIEQQRAKEAMLNAAHYQKKAAFARSERI